MAADRPEAQILALIAEFTHTKPERLDLGSRIDEQGIDSLQLIVLRERLQMEIGAVFSDEEWMSLKTPADILSVHVKHTETVRTEVQSTTSPSSSATGSFMAAGLSVHDVEIGMPLTGRNNLAETPLLQYLGDLRWRDISGTIGVPTRQIVDDEGERLYATFFYVEVAFPPERPMAAFGENDRFTVVSTLARYGTSMLDGVSYLVPVNGRSAHVDQRREAPFSSLQEAVAAGVPAVRLSNIFVKKFAGAEWLKKGRPVHPRFTQIPALSDPPDSYLTTKDVEQTGTFGMSGPQSIPMTDGPVQREYQLVPDRDLNGAGLVYFANYPMFLDICERDVLLSARLPLSENLIDRRTVIHRQSAYLNNASAGDTLRIEIEPWVRVAGVRRPDNDETTNLHLHINCRMYRRSDERLMMVSTVQKVVGAVSIADTPFALR